MAYIGEIKLWPGIYAPRGWAFCAGQSLSISDNDFLYSKIGTTYGGDGIDSFNLPDLRGRVPIHHAPAYPVGTAGGSEKVSLLQSHLPQHNHLVNCAGAADSADPTNRFWGRETGETGFPYSAGAPNAFMAANSVGTAGQGAPHENMMPFQVLNYIIALEQDFDDTPYICEIRPFAFDFVPQGWAPCAGNLVAIQQNPTLFALLGTNFGGNGSSTFGLPNLVAQVPVGAGAGPGLTPRAIGQTGGVPSVTLTEAEMGAHSHLANCTTVGGNLGNPANAIWGTDGDGVISYGTGVGTALAPGAIGMAGGVNAHENRQPYLAITYGIAIQGVFPPRG